MSAAAALNASLVRLGRPGVVGLGLLVAVAGFYLSASLPQQASLDDAREELVRLRNRMAVPDAASTPISPGRAAYDTLPLSSRLPAVLSMVFDAARSEALILRHGDYRLVPAEAGSKVVQYQLNLPVRGTYPQIRRFLDEAMRRDPALALKSIHFERHKIDDSDVEAKIMLIIFMAERQ